MGQNSREAAQEVKEQLDAAKYHLDRAAEKVVRVPDKELQRKVQQAVEKHGDAKTHVDKGLESK